MRPEPAASRSKTASSSLSRLDPPLLTKPANNPPPDTTPTTPSKALRVVRVVIALGLCVGIAAFAVFTIKELEAGQAATKLPSASDFGISTSSPGDSADAPGKGPLPGLTELTGLTGTDPTKYIPIVRDNPHPGQFAPFMRADPYGQVPYKQSVGGGETWETCAYRVNDASLTDLIAHYHDQATQVGMKLTKQKATSAKMPGGIVAVWSDGRRSLRVTGWPEPTDKPATPPLRQPIPLEWVVQYSYPAKGQ